MPASSSTTEGGGGVAAEVGKGSGSNSLTSREDASHLISLLSELLFHRQTEVSHRRNIATLLIRLLPASSDGAHANKRTDARRMTRESLWACLKHSGDIDPT